MAKKKPKSQRKTRTRQHIVADLAVNHFEKPILLHGSTIERIVHDYGLDLMLFTYNSAGEPQKGVLYLQVKGTEKVTRIEGGQTISFRIDRIDLVSWLDEVMPVILCVYDASSDTGYWLYLQRYFESLPEFNIFAAGATLSVRIPATQIVDVAAVERFAQFLEEVRQQMHGSVDHAETDV